MTPQSEEFNGPAAPLSEAERALTAWGIPYEKQADGMILVPGHLDIFNRGLTRLPDLSKVIVKGDFRAQENKLTSLKGSPHSVGGSFLCSYNLLTSLEGAPDTVVDDFWCHGNRLADLKGAPKSVGGSFLCQKNPLASLAGAPASVGESFICHTSPALRYLENAPQKFKTLISDFGTFGNWEAVPEHLRLSPETAARRERERKDRIEDMIRRHITVQTPFRAGPPLRFQKKKGGP